MRPLPVDLSEDVEDEGLHVEVERLVIQEEFSQQTQVLTIELDPDRTSEHIKTTALEKLKN